MIRFAVPKGSLEAETKAILERAWYGVVWPERSYRPKVRDPEIELKVLRPQEIPVYVAEGYYDIGITGLDWVVESDADVVELLDLEYGGVKLVLAAPPMFKDMSLSDLLVKFKEEGRCFRVSTEYPKITRSYLMKNESYKRLYGGEEPLIITPWWKVGENEMVRIFLSFGATEAKPPEEVDAIVDATRTGTTLRRNNLEQLEVVMESTARLIANRDSLDDEAKREKIYDVVSLLKGVVDSDKKLHIFLNVREENLGKLVSSLPALKSPTISKLSTEGWYSVNTVIGKDDFFKILPLLRKFAQGLVVHKPDQILPLEEIKDESEEGKGKGA